MNTKTLYFACAIFTLLLACSPEETDSDDNNANSGQTVEVKSFTVEADHISAISVVLKGRLIWETRLPQTDLIIGFQYSKSASIMPYNSTIVVAREVDNNYNYSAGINGLEPNTTYYFRYFIVQNGQDTYGETKEFKTKDVSSLLETRNATEIEATSVTLNSKLDLTDVQYSNISYGFYWGRSETAQNGIQIGGDIAENAFAASLTNLSHKTQYWYKAYVKLDSQAFFGEIKSFITDVVPVASVSLDMSEFTFDTIGSTLTLNATVLPADATDKSLEWTSSNENVVSVDAKGTIKSEGKGTATIKAEANDGSGVYAACQVTVKKRSCLVPIDLGLPSGLKWANANLGADAPEDYGDYYAWGETEPYYSSQNPFTWKDGKTAGYVWASYKWCNGSYDTLNKYNCLSSYGVVDNIEELQRGEKAEETVDDAAWAQLDGKWRMPTYHDWVELNTNCTWEKTGAGHNVAGYRVTGPNGNSIFFPAAGFLVDVRLINSGSNAYYWSSSLTPLSYNKNPSAAHAVCYDPYGFYLNWQDRCWGLSIRPVLIE